MAVLDEARRLVESRLVEIDQEKARLERALKELGGSVKRRSRAGRPKGSAKKVASGTQDSRRRGPRTGPGRLQQVLEHFQKEPNARTKDVAAGVGISANAVSSLKKEAKVRGLAEDGPDGELIVRRPSIAGEDSTRAKRPATADGRNGPERKGRRGKGKLGRKASTKASARD